MNQIQNKYVILGSLCALLLTLVVGYAAFSTVLKIKGTSTINSNWDVRITHIEKIESQGATEAEGTPKHDELSATFNTSFTTPGDYATYKIEITNNGSLDAILKNITMPENTNNDIIFYLNKNQNNEEIKDALKQNDTLFKSGKTGNIGYVYVTVLYRDYENQQTPTKDEDKTASMTITFDFEQIDNNGIIEPNNTIVYRRGPSLYNGDSLENVETTTDPSTFGKNIFLKHITKDGQIESSEVCFIKEGEIYCLKPNEFEISGAKLINIFGESACNIRSSVVRCTWNNIGASALSNNDVDAFDESDSDARLCGVTGSGNARCGYW